MEAPGPGHPLGPSGLRFSCLLTRRALSVASPARRAGAWARREGPSGSELRPAKCSLQPWMLALQSHRQTAWVLLPEREGQRKRQECPETRFPGLPALLQRKPTGASQAEPPLAGDAAAEHRCSSFAASRCDLTFSGTHSHLESLVKHSQNL